MSSSLRAAIIIAVPTTIVTLGGIYWFRKKRDKSRNSSSDRTAADTSNGIDFMCNESKALSETDCEEKSVGTGDDQKLPICESELCGISKSLICESLGTSRPDDQDIIIETLSESFTSTQWLAAESVKSNDAMEIKDTVKYAQDEDFVSKSCLLTHNQPEQIDTSLILSSERLTLLYEQSVMGRSVSEEEEDEHTTSAYIDISTELSVSLSVCNDVNDCQCLDNKMKSRGHDAVFVEAVRMCDSVAEEEECAELMADGEDVPLLNTARWSETCSTPIMDLAGGDSLSTVSVDSGQGGSNGPLTPSDPNIISPPNVVIYVFDFPTKLCGMLIGRNGQTINGISRRSGAWITVKEKLYSKGLQCVNIEGNQRQVNEALAMIKKRFPAFKYPNIDFSPSIAIDLLDNFPLSQLTLPEVGPVDVIISSVVTSQRIFIQQPTHPTFALLNYLNECMWACYSQEVSDSLLLPSPIDVNTLCVAPMFGGWFRAQIVELCEELDQCLVRFVDYGGYCQIDTIALRQIRTDFTALPFQAVECFLSGVEVPPSSDEDDSSLISTQAKCYLESIAQTRQFAAELVSYTDDGAALIELYQFIGEEMYSINKELIASTTIPSSWEPEVTTS